jgi:esterase/lipase superfamily enzyme
MPSLVIRVVSKEMIEIGPYIYVCMVGAVAALMYASHHGDRVRHIVNVSGRFDFVDAGPTEEQMKILREKVSCR